MGLLETTCAGDFAVKTFRAGAAPKGGGGQAPASASQASHPLWRGTSQQLLQPPEVPLLGHRAPVNHWGVACRAMQSVQHDFARSKTSCR